MKGRFIRPWVAFLSNKLAQARLWLSCIHFMQQIHVYFTKQLPCLTHRILKKLRYLGYGFLVCATGVPTLNDLIEQSMLYQARQIRQSVSGSRTQWHHPFMTPSVDFILSNHSVWFDAYPAAMVHEKNEPVLSFLSQATLWQTFRDMGIQALHTGPMQQAGGYSECQFTPSVDGGFDPISLHIDTQYGSDERFIQMSEQAQRFGNIIISDLIPGHTGKGIDFYLALLGVHDYQGLYTLIDIPRKYWPFLPVIKTARRSQNLTPAQVERLSQANILPGHLQRVMYSQPNQTSTGWDVTGEIQGIDGKAHRYAYLHYFKPGQPTLNWLDASFSAHQLMSAHIIHAVHRLKAKMLRIDANPFLGLERIQGTTQTRSEGTHLAINASTTIAQMIRKMGAFSFQELNLSLEKTKQFMQNGADFSYDFITRPAVEHALLTGDARLLNTLLQLSLDQQIDMRRLEHGLQNHDEITYELVEFSEHPEQLYRFGQDRLRGKDIRNLVIGQMRTQAMAKSYLHTNQNGLCTTLAGLIASRLELDDPYHASKNQVRQIQQGMQLILAFNALLPGVINLSGWDLVGALPLKAEDNSPYRKDSDCRWLNRGAYQLLQQSEPVSQLPKAQSLFANLSDQLKQPTSFASQVKSLLTFRQQHKLAKAKLMYSLFHQRELVGFITQTKTQQWLMLFNFSAQPQSISNALIKADMHRRFNHSAMTFNRKQQRWQIAPMNFAVFSSPVARDNYDH